MAEIERAAQRCLAAIDGMHCAAQVAPGRVLLTRDVIEVCEAVQQFAKLAELAAKLPKGLCSDWDGTNHYELTCAGKDYFWLMVGEGCGAIIDPCHSVEGRRLGLIMDIAAEVSRLRDAGLLKGAR